ncbi:hypothetical protein BDN72DRAFT_835225 [Pluteus cervinus]|uniref:Uncharacterized protein n=1 Tax=Pluteus cervinus TaxID=181527 RepID=A0ACD3B4D6_9AGAR|nr:hypothetical protein BDN72DRAFT_835225 [Pluteus cervinus]
MAFRESGISPNTEFPDVNQEELRELLEDAISKASRLEAQIAPLQSIYTGLLEAVTYYKAALAPWKHLPNELLQRVFLFLPLDHPPCIPFSRRAAPIQVTQVCARWREVAFATPSIWQKFKCPIYLNPDTYRKEDAIAFLNLWISRAGTRPLSIITPCLLDSSAEEWMEASPHKFNLIKHIILPHSSRIGELTVRLPYYYPHTGAFLHSSPDFALLEKLVLWYTLPSIGQDEPNALCKNAPRLKHLEFEAPVDRLIQLNWATITDVHLRGCHAHIFLSALREMTTLRHCRASLYSTMGWETTDITLPSLLSFDIDMDMHGNPFENVQFIFPKLERLSINIPERWTHVSTSILQYASSLREFHLESRDRRSVRSLRQVLEASGASKITDLSVKFYPEATLDKQTLQAIGSGQILPQLRNFICEGPPSIKQLAELFNKKGFATLDSNRSLSPTSSDYKGDQSDVSSVPFERVKILSCRPRYMTDSRLCEIISQVGDRLVLEPYQPPRRPPGLAPEQRSLDID